MNSRRKQIASLSQQALKLWGEGKFAESEAMYRDAISLFEETHNCGSFELSQQLAGVLAAQNRDGESLKYYQRALQYALKYDNNDENQNSIQLSRYFLGEQLCRMTMYDEVLDCIDQSIQKCESKNGLLLHLKAIALFKLKREEEAKVIAHQSLNAISNSVQKEKIRKILQNEIGEMIE